MKMLKKYDRLTELQLSLWDFFGQGWGISCCWCSVLLSIKPVLQMHFYSVFWSLSFLYWSLQSERKNNSNISITNVLLQFLVQYSIQHIQLTNINKADKNILHHTKRLRKQICYKLDMTVRKNNLLFHCAWHWGHWSPSFPGSCSDTWSLFHSPSCPSRRTDQPGNHGNSGWIYDDHLIKKKLFY